MEVDSSPGHPGCAGLAGHLEPRGGAALLLLVLLVLLVLASAPPLVVLASAAPPAVPGAPPSAGGAGSTRRMAPPLRLLLSLSALPYSEADGHPVFAWRASLACGHLLGLLLRALAREGEEPGPGAEGGAGHPPQPSPGPPPPPPPPQPPHRETILLLCPHPPLSFTPGRRAAVGKAKEEAGEAPAQELARPPALRPVGRAGGSGRPAALTRNEGA
jgi:hypothetical protein